MNMEDPDILRLLELGCSSSEGYIQVHHALSREAQRCVRCRELIRRHDTNLHGDNAGAERVQVALRGTTSLMMDNYSQLLIPALQLPDSADDNDDDVDYNEPIDKIDAYFQSRPNKDPSKIYMGVSVMTEKIIKARTIPQRIRNGVSSIELDEALYKGRQLGDDMSFDDYLGGPSIQDVTIPHNPGLEKETPTLGVWQLFQDWGYRLRPSSLHQFYLNAPTTEEALAHCLSIPPPEMLEKRLNHKLLMQLDSFQAFSGGVENIGKFGPIPRSLIETVQTVTWGIVDITQFHNTGHIHSDESRSAYILGRWTQLDESKLIILDLEKDAISIPPKHITISIDIDSVIWVTFLLSVKTSISIHMLPYFGKKAPIHINNHVYINLLWPRSEYDISTGSRQEWQENKVPLSHIPHTHFARVGQGHGSANVYVFFPRMMHRKEQLPFWEVRIPNEVQCWWLNHVIYPAMWKVTHDRSSLSSYMNFTLDEMRTKSGTKPGKTLPMSPGLLFSLQNEMRRIIRMADSSESLEPFGSFFFALDIRGIKLLTTSDDVETEDPYDMLRSEYFSLDWDYMMDRRNGELMMDVGVGFHPPMDAPASRENSSDPTEGEGIRGAWEPGGPWGSLTGIWRREKLELSYDRAGFNKGSSHSACTLSDYGGLQAEMPRSRGERVHMNFRQSYNLAYEVIRGTKTRERSLFSPKDAYSLNDTFDKSTRDLAAGFFGSTEKSYGVREEFRASGSIIRQLLPVIKERVRVVCFFKRQLSLNPIFFRH